MRKILDERERLARQQHWRLIVTETLMFLAVIILVGFLTLVVMGYSFNLREIGGTGEVVERSGLVQISSVPTGAAVYVDGETSLLLNTNTSRAMTAGEHEIALVREGFDGWRKTVNVTEGMMYRLNYPRLFREEREVEEVLEISEEVSFVSVSPNREKMVLVEGGVLYIANLNEKKPELAKLAVLDAEGAALKVDTLVEAEWSGNSERLFAKVNGEWAVINVRDARTTVWLDSILTVEAEKQGSCDERSAGASCAKIVISDIKFENEAGDRLLILTDQGELRELSIREEKLSEALVKGVVKFDNDGDRVVYVTKEISKIEEEPAEGDKVETGAFGQEKSDVTFAGVRLDTVIGEVRVYRIGEEESYLITQVSGEVGDSAGDIRVATMRYFLESYVAVANKKRSGLVVYKTNGWVSGDGKMEEFYVGGKVIASDGLKERGKGMVFELVAGEEKSVFDIEAMGEVAIESREGEEGWIDDYLRYWIDEDGGLFVMDYDGLNERKLVAKDVLKGRTVTISGDNRWLYYFVKEAKIEKLVRERIL